MKSPLCLLMLLLLTFLSSANGLFAQTLTERLLDEEREQLIEMALQKGNVVRGAILFHQGNINCAKCHRPTADGKQIGPDLSRLGEKMTVQEIAESILSPSKKIGKDYETLLVLTSDGIVITGKVLAEDDEKIVLRNVANSDEIITILQEDVEETQPGEISLMPDGLVNELKNRQQFFDLLRYVVDLRDRGPTQDVATAHTVGLRQLTAELEGRFLIQEFKCAACHEAPEFKTGISPKQAPNLNWSRKHLNPRYLADFISAPHTHKPGTKMPDVMAHLSAEEKKYAATALSQFLLSGSDNTFAKQTPAIEEQAIRSGEQLFHSIGCVACHAPRDAESQEQQLADSIPLGTLTQKYSLNALIAFLENPHVVRPSGRMPNMQLKRSEATDISSFLLQGSQPKKTIYDINPKLAAQGKKLFTELRCASCHTQVAEAAKASTPASIQPPAFREVRPKQGCLSGQVGPWPNFSLNQQQTEQLRTAIAQPPTPLNKAQQVSVTLRTFNCIACHRRGDLGGVAAERNSHFKTTNMNLGDQGRIPPTLNHVGAKLQAKWMRDVLINGRSIRSYMQTRMPQYGEAHVIHLVDLFQQLDQLPAVKQVATDQVTYQDLQKIRHTGRDLAGSKGLNCVACHTYKDQIPDTMPAVDLTLMTERLQRDWFHHYMITPQKFSPNTVMPSFWPSGKALRKDLEGDAHFQVEALWQYLIDAKQLGAPQGLVKEKLEIVVTDEAKMLRRSYPNIGKRGIGVGYPGGVNLAWDAEQMRLAMIWPGKFIDPSGVWTGQGSGHVRPLGRRLNFARGPDLDDAINPWLPDNGRPPHHKFRGYQLDKKRRPTFRYQYQDVTITDYYSEQAGPSEGNNAAGKNKKLTRTVTLSSPTDQAKLRFRLASGDQIASNEKNGQDNQYSIGEGIQLRILSKHTTQIVQTKTGLELQIPIKLTRGVTQTIVLEYSWQQ